MSDTRRWTFRIRVEGMALWIRREHHIDVLFPDDRLGGTAQHHVVTVHDAFVAAQPDGDPLDGATLDFTELVTVPPLRRVRYPSGTVPVEIEPGSIASDPDAVLTGTGLVAGLRLPLGTLNSLGDERGPFHLGADHTMYLGYGACWTAIMDGPQPLQARTVTHQGRSPGELWSNQWAATSSAPVACDQSLTVRCLSADDRAHKVPLTYLEPLSEVGFLGYISKADGTAFAPVPIYHGSERSCSPATPRILAYPERPCPSGVGNVGGTA